MVKKTTEDKYAIIVKGFDHGNKKLIALIHEYNFKKKEISFIKKIEINETKMKLDCVSMMYCSF